MRKPLLASTLVLLVLAGCSKNSKSPVAPQPAEVIVVGQPLGAILTVDGRQIGPTPQTVGGLTAGSHTFALTDFQGYADSSFTRSIPVGSESLKVDLRPLVGTPSQIVTWDIPYAGGSQRDTPYAIAVTYAGAVWVAGSSGTIYRFDIDGVLQESWSTTGMGGTASLAASSSRIIYGSSVSGVVGIYTTSGAVLHQLTSTPTNVLDQWHPLPQPAIDEFAVDVNFVPTTDQYGTSTQVQRYSDAGIYLSRWMLHTDVNIPQPVARYATCDQSHHVFVLVAGSGHQALDKYAEDGTFLQRWDPFPANNLAVQGTIAYRVGDLVTRTDLVGGGSYSWQLTEGRIASIPAAAAACPDGVFIADSANRRIIRYVLE